MDDSAGAMGIAMRAERDLNELVKNDRTEQIGNDETHLVKASFDHNYGRKNGAIITADYDYKEHARLTWTHGLISEIGF